jgi:hypothetical protein
MLLHVAIVHKRVNYGHTILFAMAVPESPKTP